METLPTPEDLQSELDDPTVSIMIDAAGNRVKNIRQSEMKEIALHTAESILALLHYRGLVDSQVNRDDVATALGQVRTALSGKSQTYQADRVPEPRKTWKDKILGR